MRFSRGRASASGPAARPLETEALTGAAVARIGGKVHLDALRPGRRVTLRARGGEALATGASGDAVRDSADVTDGSAARGGKIG